MFRGAALGFLLSMVLTASTYGDLKLTVNVSPPEVKPGKELTLVIQVENTGTATLRSVQLATYLSEMLFGVPSLDGGTCQGWTTVGTWACLGGGTVRWSLGDIAAGRIKQVTIKPQVKNTQAGSAIDIRCAAAARNVNAVNVSVQVPVIAVTETPTDVTPLTSSATGPVIPDIREDDNPPAPAGPCGMGFAEFLAPMLISCGLLPLAFRSHKRKR
jgi:hypothetical protein